MGKATTFRAQSETDRCNSMIMVMGLGTAIKPERPHLFPVGRARLIRVNVVDKLIRFRSGYVLARLGVREN